jgi:tetratricopeptide (TPR) repeat protein
MPDNVEIRINLGELLLADDAEGRRRQGAELLEEVLLKDPHRLHLSRLLVKYYTETGYKGGRARDHYRRLIEAGDPTSDAYLEYALMLTNEGRLREAAEALRKMCEVLPDDWRGHHRLARIYFTQGKLDEADEALRRAGPLVAGEGEALTSHLRRDIDRRRSELRLAAMNEALDPSIDDVPKRLELIEELISMEWIDRALGLCEELLDAHPEALPDIEQRLMQGIQRNEHGFRLRDYLGDIYFQQERYDDLLQLYRQMADRSLDPAQALIEGCLKILARAPNHLPTRQELAFARRSLQDWAGVIDALDPPLLADDPGLMSEDKALWVEAASRLGRAEDAIRVGEPLTGVLADEISFVMLMIGLYQEREDHEGAWRVFEKGRAALPDEPRLEKIESKIAQNRKKYRLTRLQAQHTENNLTAHEHFEKAELHRDLGDYANAIIHYQRAADEEELALVALAKMAVSLCDRGMIDLAYETIAPIELTREIVEKYPELKDSFFSVARSLEKMKRTEECIELYKRIFRVDAGYGDVVERLQRLG